MSGGYFACGSWLGEDKSATAFFVVLEALEEVLQPEERAVWEAKVVTPLQSQLATLDEGEPPYFSLSPSMLDELVPPARRYFDALHARLGQPDDETWHEIGEWKFGEGWQLICLSDLFCADEACRESGEDVVVFFD